MSCKQIRLLLIVFSMGLLINRLHALPLTVLKTVTTISCNEKEMIPQACDTPSAQPRYIGMESITADSASGYLEPVADADGYLVVISTSARPNFIPTTGTIYTVGSTVGNSKVVKVGNGKSFTVTGLRADTSYYVYGFSMKSNCQGGPVYRSGSPTAVMVHTPVAVSN